MSLVFYAQHRSSARHDVPTGTVISSVMLPSTGPPTGWLVCDGRDVSRDVYKKLFALIGTRFGAGDGETTFRLPDMRERVAVGCNDDKSEYRFGRSGGRETYRLQTDDLPPHTHTGTTYASGAHSHTSNATGTPYSLATYNEANTARSGLDSSPNEPNLFAGPVALTINEAPAHTHGFETNTTGGGRSINLMQPYVALTFLIHI